MNTTIFAYLQELNIMKQQNNCNQSYDDIYITIKDTTNNNNYDDAVYIDITDEDYSNGFSSGYNSDNEDVNVDYMDIKTYNKILRFLTL